ncbi:MAG: ComF family protein [Candidatus Gastranaerophilales bacterium]|nr:ComF family protein [Candidatus Gastranaerophilales bacterium]
MFKSLINSFLNLIYNQKCLVCACSKTDDLLCKNCLKDIQYLSSFAQRFYKEIPIFCATNYQKTTKSLIRKLKFSHNKKASIPLTNILYTYFLKLNLTDEYIIIYPPSNYLKTSIRGYNHMYLIANAFSKLTNFKINKDLIKKTKPTKPQYKAKNRHLNIKDSFMVNKKYIEELKDKKLLLIDDITTSGATLEEIINVLLDVGLKNIICLTISKAGC